MRTSNRFFGLFLLFAGVAVGAVLFLFTEQVGRATQSVHSQGYSCRVVLKEIVFTPGSANINVEVVVDPRIPVRVPYVILLPEALGEPLVIDAFVEGTHNFIWKVQMIRSAAEELTELTKDWLPADRPVSKAFEIRATGYPILFPFDSYKLLAYVYPPGAYKTESGYLVRRSIEDILLDNQLLTFEYSLLSSQEILDVLRPSASRRDLATGKSDLQLSQELADPFFGVHWNRQGGLAVRLQRPRAIRWFLVGALVASVLWLIRLLSISFSRAYSESGLMVGILLGVRLTVWDNAPTFPTLLDYSTLAVIILTGVALWINWIKQRSETSSQSDYIMD